MIRNNLKLSNFSNNSISSLSQSTNKHSAISIKSRSKSKEQKVIKPQKEMGYIRTKSTVKCQQQIQKKSLNKEINKAKQSSRQKSRQKLKENIRTNNQNSKDKQIKNTIKRVKQRAKQPIKNKNTISKINEKSLSSTLTQFAAKNNKSTQKRSNQDSQSRLNISSIKKEEPHIMVSSPYNKNSRLSECPNKEFISSSIRSKTNIQNHSQVKVDESFLKYIPHEIVREHKKVKFQDFIILRLISQESYFKQYLTLNKVTHCLFNIRVLNKRQIIEQQMQTQLQESIKIHYLLSTLVYKHIQKIYTIFDDPIHIYIILEPFLPEQIHFNHANGLRQEDRMIKESQICFLFQSILQIVQQIHKHHIVLRNLSFSSIKNFMGLIYLTNLDRATSLKSKKFRNSFFGNAKQAPHQLLIYKAYDFSYDMWSLGILLYQLSTGLHPFQGPNEIETIKSLQFPIPMLISNKLVKLISSLLIQNQHRLTIDQCLKHELINKQFMNKHLIFRDIWNFLSQ